MTQNILIPEIRFPEFAKDGEWNEWTLADKASITKGKGISKAEIVPDGKLECIRYGELYTDYSEIIRRVNSRTNTPATELVLSKKGDVIIPASGETKIDIATASCVTSAGVALGGDLNIIRCDVDGSFLSYYLNGPKKIDIAGRAQGVSVMHLYPNQLGKLQLATPSKAEQQKIADCLGSLDNLIATHNRKLAALQDHKKGLLQQLFPAEGETTPKLRFPEFKNTGEWKEVQLGRKIDIKGRIGYRGYTVNDIVNKGEGAISLSPSNISDSGALSFDKSTFITWDKYRESPEIILEPGQTLLVKTGSTFGKTAFIKSLPQEATINPQIVILKPKDIDPYFLYLLMAGNIIQAKINAAVVGGAIPTLSQEVVSKFKIRIPPTTEQKRIAECLSEIDMLVSSQAEKISGLKEHKKGLMQQLFPNPDLKKP